MAELLHHELWKNISTEAAEWKLQAGIDHHTFPQRRYVHAQFVPVAQNMTYPTNEFCKCSTTVTLA
jgi:hypothetical protein